MQAKVVVEKQRQNALIPGTVEFQNMEEINNNIRAHNDYLRAFKSKDMKGRKRIRTVENVYKHIELTRGEEKRGIDWFLYQKYILIPHSYRLYEEVQASNPGTNIWLIEDNAPSHSKATQVCKKNREERGIRKVD